MAGLLIVGRRETMRERMVVGRSSLARRGLDSMRDISHDIAQGARRSHMKWILIGVGALFLAGWLHSMRRSHYDHWLDEDA